jgi:hypothetical protein
LKLARSRVAGRLSHIQVTPLHKQLTHWHPPTPLQPQRGRKDQVGEQRA